MIKNFFGYLHKTLSEKEIEEMNKNAEVVYQKSLEEQKKEKHYHYLVGYFFMPSSGGGFGFGDMAFELEEEINSVNIEEIRKEIYKSLEENKGIEAAIITIISISPLGCRCEDS